MKIAVISDTHLSNNWKDIPDKLFQELKNADMLIHAGDLTDLAILGDLKKICRNIAAVHGNMDSEEVKKRFPEKQVLSAGKFKIGLMHGYGPPDQLVERMKENFANSEVNLVIFGHSHNALNLKKEGIIYFNPGSPTDTIYATYNSFGIIEINDKIEARIIKL